MVKKNDISKRTYEEANSLNDSAKPPYTLEVTATVDGGKINVNKEEAK